VPRKLATRVVLPRRARGKSGVLEVKWEERSQRRRPTAPRTSGTMVW
jgi:hypothetical protein